MVLPRERHVNACQSNLRYGDDEMLIPFALDADGNPIVDPDYAAWLRDHNAAKDRGRDSEMSPRPSCRSKLATKAFVRKAIRHELRREIAPIVEYLQEAKQ